MGRKYAKKKSLKRPRRIVFYRDGPCRFKERINIINGLKRVEKTLDYGENINLDIVEVIKKHHKRIYKTTTDSIKNPKFGLYIVIPSSKYYNGRALVISTDIPKKMKDKVDFTTEPIELRYISYSSKTRGIKTIVEEYLALTALNFWNPFRKTKLCLPLLLAHKIANLTRIGVSPKLGL